MDEHMLNWHCSKGSMADPFGFGFSLSIIAVRPKKKKTEIRLAQLLLNIKEVVQGSVQEHSLQKSTPA